jgi:hypothetical protein
VEFILLILLVLPPNEKAISRLHCKIETEEGFGKTELIEQDFLTLLFVSKKRLPFQAIKLIREFVRLTPKFYLVDMGSSSGTYIRVRPDRERDISSESIYLIGAET